MTTIDQPGSSNDEIESPQSKQRLIEKKEMCKLNQRLEMYVTKQNERAKEIEVLKGMLSSQEIEFRSKIKENEKQYELIISKLRNENENYQFNLRTLQEELNAINHEKKDAKNRLDASESRVNEQMIRIESLQQENVLLKKDADNLRINYSNLKYKHENYENEKNNLISQLNSSKDRSNSLMKELTKRNSEYKSQQDDFTRLIKEKSDEIEKLKQQIIEATSSKEETISNLRNELDQKLKEFVEKREEQYKLEKEEWMKIFKEEYNRKLRGFKEANEELSTINSKNEEELNDLRSRLVQLKQTKSELEILNRNLEEELDKLRTDLNSMRQFKDEEIRQKIISLNEWKDKYKQKEIEFDQLTEIKIQLSQEIDLYRQILSEAEKVAGISSPFDCNARKKRRLNTNEEINKDNNNNNNNTCETSTPGIVRGAQLARKELNCLTSDNNSDNNNNNDNNNNIENNYNTPGEIYPLQFSTIDLSKSFIEIQNISERSISLKGYTLSNQNGSNQFPLPFDKVLQPNECVKIIIGLKEKAPNGSIHWKADVWSGEEQDEIRLYDPSNKEISQIQITPDMLSDKIQGGCLIM